MYSSMPRSSAARCCGREALAGHRQEEGNRFDAHRAHRVAQQMVRQAPALLGGDPARPRSAPRRTSSSVVVQSLLDFRHEIGRQVLGQLGVGGSAADRRLRAVLRDREQQVLRVGATRCGRHETPASRPAGPCAAARATSRWQSAAHCADLSRVAVVARVRRAVLHAEVGPRHAEAVIVAGIDRPCRCAPAYGRPGSWPARA